MKTLIRFPDGLQVVGEPESLFELIGMTQMYYVADFYQFFLECIHEKYERFEGFLSSNGEHPKFKETFPFEKQDQEQMYYLCNSVLYLDEAVKNIKNLLKKGVQLKQLSKKKHALFVETLDGIQKDLDKVNGILSKSSDNPQ